MLGDSGYFFYLILEKISLSKMEINRADSSSLQNLIEKFISTHEGRKIVLVTVE